MISVGSDASWMSISFPKIYLKWGSKGVSRVFPLIKSLYFEALVTPSSVSNVANIEHGVCRQSKIF
jgi:hypothetical protein